MATYGALVIPNGTPAISGTPFIPGTAAVGATANGTTTPAGTTAPGTVTPTFTPSIQTTALPTLAKGLIGIQVAGNLSDADWNTAIGKAQQLNIGWIKVQVQWKALEPGRNNFNPQYYGMVQDIQRAHTSGFKTLIGIDKAPDWARAAGTHPNDGPPADPKDLADFLTKFIGDIKPEFVDAVEIWNEPNLRSEWDGVPINGSTYLKYFDVSYKAIRATEQLTTPTFGQAHHIIIVTAGPATGTPDSGDTVSDRTWIKQLYSAGLAHYGGDIALGAHPYGWGNAPEADCCAPGPNVPGWYTSRSFYFKDTLDDYHQIMVDNQHAAQIWVTEFGWATFDGLHNSDGSPAKQPTDPSLGWMNVLNQSQQADYTIRALNLAQHAPYSNFLGPAFLWNLNFATIPGQIETQTTAAGFSALDFNNSPRALYNALAAAPKQ